MASFHNRRWVKDSVTAMMIGLTLVNACVPVLAGPTGESVQAGQVSVQRDGALTQINASNNSIINWNQFNIAGNETVRFIQPGADSRVLNRVTDSRVTQIDGNLFSNGHVYILNPAGVFFGGQAVVNVGALTAAAGSITNQNFLNNIDSFTNLQGQVVNQGLIQGDAAVRLLGNRVSNVGSIVSNGYVLMGAGDEAYLTDRNSPVLVRVGNKSSSTTDAAVENKGTIDAGNGKVYMGAADVYALAVRNEGIVKAKDIAINAPDAQVQVVGGSLLATDRVLDKGGNIVVTGNEVVIAGAADLNASGANGGGAILVGGGYQGNSPEIHNAQNTYVGPNAKLTANATENGDGGFIVVWSDKFTGFYGSLDASGAGAGRNGGFGEISSHLTLDSRGAYRMDPGQGGQYGTLLFDPFDIMIVGGAGDGSDGTISGDANGFASLEATGTGTGVIPGTITFTTNGAGNPAPQPFIVFESELEGSSGLNLNLQARNAIYVSGNFTDGNLDGRPDLIFGGRNVQLRTRNAAGDNQILTTTIDPVTNLIIISISTASFSGVFLAGTTATGFSDLQDVIMTDTGSLAIDTNSGGTATTTQIVLPERTILENGDLLITNRAGSPLGSIITNNDTDTISSVNGNISLLSTANNAGGSINIGGVSTVGGNIVATAANNGSILFHQGLSTNTGNITLSTTGTNNTFGTIATTFNNSAPGAITSQGGNISIAATNNVSVNVGTISTTGSGTVSVTGVNPGIGTINPTVGLVTGNITTTTGNITVNAATAGAVTTGAITTGDFAAATPVSGNVVLRSGNNGQISTAGNNIVANGGDITVAAFGTATINVNDITTVGATGDISMTAVNGVVNGIIMAAHDLRTDAGNITLNQTGAGNSFMTLHDVSTNTGLISITSTTTNISFNDITSQLTDITRNGVNIATSAAGDVSTNNITTAGTRIRVLGDAITTLGAITPGILPGGVIDIQGRGNASFGGDIIAETIILRSGIDGTGNMNFTSSGGQAHIFSNVLTLRAGDGLGGGGDGGSINVNAGLPVFGNLVNDAPPPRWFLQQDATIGDNQIVQSNLQFTGGAALGIDYILQSDAGSINVTPTGVGRIIANILNPATGPNVQLIAPAAGQSININADSGNGANATASVRNFANLLMRSPTIVLNGDDGTDFGDDPAIRQRVIIDTPGDLIIIGNLRLHAGSTDSFATVGTTEIETFNELRGGNVFITGGISSQDNSGRFESPDVNSGGNDVPGDFDLPLPSYKNLKIIANGNPLLGNGSVFLGGNFSNNNRTLVGSLQITANKDIQFSNTLVRTNGSQNYKLNDPVNGRIIVANDTTFNTTPQTAFVDTSGSTPVIVVRNNNNNSGVTPNQIAPPSAFVLFDGPITTSPDQGRNITVNAQGPVTFNGTALQPAVRASTLVINSNYTPTTNGVFNKLDGKLLINGDLQLSGALVVSGFSNNVITTPGTLETIHAGTISWNITNNDFAGPLVIEKDTVMIGEAALSVDRAGSAANDPVFYTGGLGDSANTTGRSLTLISDGFNLELLTFTNRISTGSDDTGIVQNTSINRIGGTLTFAPFTRTRNILINSDITTTASAAPANNALINGVQTFIVNQVQLAALDTDFDVVRFGLDDTTGQLRIANRVDVSSNLVTGVASTKNFGLNFSGGTIVMDAGVQVKTGRSITLQANAGGIRGIPGLASVEATFGTGLATDTGTFNVITAGDVIIPGDPIPQQTDLRSSHASVLTARSTGGGSIKVSNSGISLAIGSSNVSGNLTVVNNTGTATGTITSSAPILVTGSTVINNTSTANGSNIVLDHDNGFIGPVTLTTANGNAILVNNRTLVLDKINVTGNFTAQAKVGDLLDTVTTASSGIVMAANTTAHFSSDTGNIILDSPNNDYANLEVDAPNGNANVLDKNSVTLTGTSSAFNFNLTAGSTGNTGNITLPQTAILAGGSVSLTATNGGAINASSAADVSIPLAEINAAGNVTLTGAGIGNLQGIDITGDVLHNSTLTLVNTATGAADVNIQVRSDEFNVVSMTQTLASNNITVNHDGNPITYNGATHQLDFANAGPLQNITVIYNQNEAAASVVLGNLKTGTGDLQVTTFGGNITDSGTGAIIGGTATFNTGGGNLILDQNTTDFTIVTVTGANNITLRDANDLILAGTVLTGILDVAPQRNLSIGGDITKTGSGAATLLAGNGGLAGDLNFLPGSIFNSTDGTVTFQASVGSINFGQSTVNTGLGAFVVSAGDNATLGIITNANTSALPISIAAETDVIFGVNSTITQTGGSGEIRIIADSNNGGAGALTMLPTNTITGRGIVTLESGEDMTISNVNTSNLGSAGTAISMTSNFGSVEFVTAAAVSATSGDIVVNADFDINMATATLTASNGGVGLFAGNDIQVGNLTVNKTGSTSVDISAGNDVTFTANTLINSTSGNVSIVSNDDDNGGGSITMITGNTLNAGNGTILLQTGTTPGGAVTEDSIVVGKLNTTNSTINAVQIIASGDISFTTDGGISTTDGGITLTADANASESGFIFMPDNVGIFSTTGFISLTSAGDITVGDIISVQSDIALTSTSGGVKDGGDTVPVDISTPGRLTVRVATGFGVGNAIETDLGSIDLQTNKPNVTGNFNINELNDIQIVNLNPNIVSNVNLVAGGAIDQLGGGNVSGGFVQLSGASIGANSQLTVASNALLDAQATSGGINIRHLGNLNIEQVRASGDVALEVFGGVNGLTPDLVPDVQGKSVSITSFGPIGSGLDVLVPDTFTVDAQGDVVINFLAYLPKQIITPNGNSVTAILVASDNVGEAVPVQLTGADLLLGSTSGPAGSDGASVIEGNNLRGTSGRAPFIPATNLPSLPSIAGLAPKTFVDILGQSYVSFVTETFGRSLVDAFQFSAPEYLAFLRSRSRSGTDAVAENARITLSGLQELGWNLRLLNLPRQGRINSLAPFTPAGMTPDQLDQTIDLLMSQTPGAELTIQASLHE